MMNKRWIAGCLAYGFSILMAGTGVAGPEFQTLLEPKASFWTMAPEPAYRATAPLGFRWSEKGRSLRAAPLLTQVLDREAPEALIRFREGVPYAVRVFFYNRGDSGRKSEKAFRTEIADTVAAMEGWIKKKGVPGRKTSRQNRVKQESLIWQFRTHRYELAWALTVDGSQPSDRPEYLRLTVTRSKAGDLSVLTGVRFHPMQIKKNLQRDPNGDVWLINVPMVDQGQKGYCAAATAERIFRYFGKEIDQHEVAQLANTTSGGGTRIDEFASAIQAVGRQYGYRIGKHLKYDVGTFEKDLKYYNRVARKKGGEEIVLPTSGMIYIDSIVRSMDRDLYVESRVSQTTAFRKFEKTVQRYVNGACPLAWSVFLGLVPETPPILEFGGHLRMIIGYNAKTKEIIYTDSWGPGHERKRMSLEHAFTITKGLWSLEPKGLRL